MRVIFLLLFALSLFAADGKLIVILLKDGKPLQGENVTIYSLKSKTKIAQKSTDSDGYVSFKLPKGEYQIRLLAKDGQMPLVYLRKNVAVESGKSSQVVLLLKQKQIALSDIEAPKKLFAKTKSKSLQKGTLSIIVRSLESKKPIQGAKIFVAGTQIEASTDSKGSAIITLPEGNQTISIIHPDFTSQTFSLAIRPKEMLTKEVELTPAAMELEEFVVLAPHVEGSIAAAITEEKNSDSIANILGAEQISQQGDSNAASALKRVAGVTIIGGKKIYIRGLGDRYSVTELNSLPLPSPNPLKRTVPLDMFPAGIIGSLQIQKSPSPDITLSWGGGYVNIRTKEVKDQDYFKLKFGLSMHSSYGKSVTTYQGGDSDWSGYDDGYRSFDGNFIEEALPQVGKPVLSLNQIVPEAKEMQKLLQKRSLNPKTTTVGPGKDIFIEGAKNFTLSNGATLSLSGNYGYKNRYRNVLYHSYDYIVSRDGTQSKLPDNTVLNSLYKESIQHGGIFNLFYKQDPLTIKYTKLYVLNTIDQTRDINGTFGENNIPMHRYFLEWRERELNADQINMSYKYRLKTIDNQLSLGLERATASEYVPNDVNYYYVEIFPGKPYMFLGGDAILRYNYRTTDDNVKDFYIRNKSTIPLFSDKDFLEIGYTKEHKTRVGRNIKIAIQNNNYSDFDLATRPIDEIIAYDEGKHLSYTLESLPKDQYDASVDRKAAFFKFSLSPKENFTLTAGLRRVDLTQKVDQMKNIQNSVSIVTNTLEFTKNLPSLSLKYFLTQNDQIRFAYGKTYVYPDFREFVNTEFIHPVFLAKISGNPDLKESEIKNYDLRYDHYFSDVDNINLTLFYKDLLNPIEDTREFTTSTLDRFSFDNAKSATIYGLEFGWYKNLGSIIEQLAPFTFSGNYSWIKSKVELTQEQKEKYVTQERGLQGLSPYVINLSLTYKEPQKRTITLAYNKMARRLMRVALKNGNVILGLDDYEIPPHLLDLTWIEKLKFNKIPGQYTLTFKIRNLLDSETKWIQGDRTTLRYKTGRTFSISFGGKF